MPSKIKLSSYKDLLEAFEAGVYKVDSSIDTRRGSIYDIAAGLGAIFWSMEQSRDKSSFESNYINLAKGSILENRIVSLGGPSKIKETNGSGTITISKTSNTSLTIYKGATISVTKGSTVKLYRTTQNTYIGSNENIKNINIESVEPGKVGSIDESRYSCSLKFEDVIPDNTIVVDRIICNNGIDMEKDADYIARYKSSLLYNRPGYPDYIIQSLKDVGISNVVLFASSDFTPDSGISAIFVNDKNINLPPSFVVLQKAMNIIESSRCIGCSCRIGSLLFAKADVDITVTLTTDPSNYNIFALELEIENSINTYFTGRENPFVFKRDRLLGEIYRNTNNISNIVFNSSTHVDTDYSNIAISDTAYSLSPGIITITITGV